MSPWELELYVTARGRSPVEEFFDNLSDREMLRVHKKLQLLEAFGTDLDRPHVAPIHGKIRELRITGQTHHRVLYVATAGRRILLLHAFTKKTRSVPNREISIAKDRYRDFLERHAPS
jgi:phage-related protein